MPKYPNPFDTAPSSQQEEYRTAVNCAREKLYNYYGTAASYFPAAYADLVKMDSMSPDQILEEARRNKLL